MTSGVTAEALAIFVAGLIAPFVVNLMKGGAISGRWALWLSVFVAFVLAAFADLLTAGLPSPDQFAVRVAAVAGVSGIVWRQFFKPAES